MTDKKTTLKNFMEEFFDFDGMVKCGFFKKEWKEDYQAQADRVCRFFGYKTVYEYGAREIRCHISEVNPSEDKPFITIIPNIYES